ncbi:hypothetical protein LXL04_021125 [Taraxacum kok-saghyz]
MEMIYRESDEECICEGLKKIEEKDWSFNNKSFVKNLSPILWINKSAILHFRMKRNQYVIIEEYAWGVSTVPHATRTRCVPDPTQISDPTQLLFPPALFDFSGGFLIFSTASSSLPPFDRIRFPASKSSANNPTSPTRTRCATAVSLSLSSLGLLQRLCIPNFCGNTKICMYVIHCFPQRNLNFDLEVMEQSEVALKSADSPWKQQSRSAASPEASKVNLDLSTSCNLRFCTIDDS